MDNPIIITLISAGTAALITGVLNIITKLIDNHSKKAERKENKIDKYYEKKENAYIRALNKLLFIKRGLSITKEDLRNSTDLFDQINEESSDLKYVDSFFRLYSSDKVFNFFFRFCKNTDLTHMFQRTVGDCRKIQKKTLIQEYLFYQDLCRKI